MGHLKKFGFEWNHNALGFKFEIKIDDKKKKKKKKIIKKYKNKYLYWSIESMKYVTNLTF